MVAREVNTQAPQAGFIARGGDMGHMGLAGLKVLEPFNGDLVVGTLYALVDGAICGLVFGWLYNLFAGKGASA